MSCSDFVEVDLPKNKLTSEAVFLESATAEAALKGIYAKIRDIGLLYGRTGLSTRMGVYTDELDNYTSEQSLEDFQNHNLLATNSDVETWWNNTYNQIYIANDVIQGVSNSTALTMEDKDQFKGEALFIRAYLHLLIVELFGDVPYIDTKNYIENTNVSRMPRALVYDSIIEDLRLAASLLPEEGEANPSGDPIRPIRPYKEAANSVLARAYLYIGNWELAELASTSVINKFGALEPDLNKVFLKESSGIIWQFKPNLEGGNTIEAQQFILDNLPSRTFALNDALFDGFEVGDQRKSDWTKTVFNNRGDTLHHAYKYKQRNAGTSVEYPVQLRLAEQYLIRAEARAELEKIPEAQSDLNAIRNRAGLPNTTATTMEELLEAILQERRVELFTEHGHRWFDLKRTGKAAEVLTAIKPNWKDTDMLLPIPEAELLLNPNLLPQNDGY
ncbi:RagB/SusD family nutrient uptake outer membrane protein [Flavivirga amylovorans]